MNRVALKKYIWIILFGVLFLLVGGIFLISTKEDVVALSIIAPVFISIGTILLFIGFTLRNLN